MKLIKLLSIVILSVLMTGFSEYEETCPVYTPHPMFKHISTSKKYSCYGQASESYRTYRCGDCSKTYVLQEFCAKGKFYTEFYHSATWCSKGKGNYHDNLQVGPSDPCSCDPIDVSY